jgi:hypothetical protein
MEDYRHRSLHELIFKIRALEEALSKLPPLSRGKLNERAAAVLGQEVLDTEVFIELIETITESLKGLSPKRRADDVLSIISGEGGRRSPLIDLWETIPATTRIVVEQEVQWWKRPPPSAVEGLKRIVNLLERSRPTPKKGPPPSLNRVFARRMESIWRHLGLEPGLQYNTYSGRHVESAFRRFCNEALAAFGDERRISARQVVNIKRTKKSLPSYRA